MTKVDLNPTSARATAERAVAVGQDELPLAVAAHHRGAIAVLGTEGTIRGQAYQKALASLVNHFSSKETLTLGEFRDLIGSARKQTQAILELFDSLKYTMRKGDERVAWQLPK